jgi:hypothetical protein
MNRENLLERVFKEELGVFKLRLNWRIQNYKENSIILKAKRKKCC